MKVQHEILTFFAHKQQQMVAKAANDMLMAISKDNACSEIDAPIFHIRLARLDLAYPSSMLSLFPWGIRRLWP